MSPASLAPRRVRLVAPLRSSLSGTAAFLALASDGRQYWVKAPNNPQGARTLIAERVVYGLGEMMNAPVPQSALIEIPPEMRWEMAPGYNLHGGIGHASLNVETAIVHDEWGTFSHDDHNRERQAAILALWDLCLGEDPQWLHQVDADMSIYTFDHGLWFGGGADWALEDLQRVGVRPWDGDLDAGVASSSGLHASAARLDGLTLEDIRSVTATVPVEWNTTEAEMSELAAVLYVRAEGVAARLRVAANHSRHP